MADDRSFDSFLKHAATRGVKRALLYEQDDDVDDDIFAGDDDKDKDEKSEKPEDKKDEPKPKIEPEEGRGGPQQAAAATRDIPTPEPDDLSMEMVVDKLNAIRSGKSLKDKDVRHRISQYFNDLNAPQRLALFAFLEGLAEVIAADISGERARQPDDPEIRVAMSREESEEDISKKSTSPRIAKPETAEYTEEKPTRRPQPDTPYVQIDAGEDAPVMVVKRR